MIRPIKSLGQNFLRDENTLRKIADSLHLQKSDVVLEIGAGHGALTKYLIRDAGTVIAVEVDERAVSALREQFEGSASIIQNDILKVNLDDLVPHRNGNFRVVGNIPYYLTSEILFYLFDNRRRITDAALMMQLEVAHRLVAKPRTKESSLSLRSSTRNALFSSRYPAMFFIRNRKSTLPSFGWPCAAQFRNSTKNSSKRSSGQHSANGEKHCGTV
jgi:16S rRNA A1518/A1519 N6-dimethyltransferase RsmA/KsgA/DIM1 with predicted DNA glycosylase/AP lyase activity